ncbi:hypothetical protein ACFV9C_42305 [Kribbella sp. NPDC059898]|uniref:hypothetical protein n=1 Tax=Kribbella sp. NPDC059898 TaxID=3346995 RepID=UPI00365B0BDD
MAPNPPLVAELDPREEASTSPLVDARKVFGWARTSQHHRLDLWILDVDGTEYVSDRHVMIRRDRLTGINRLWACTVALTPRSAPALEAALHARLSSRPSGSVFALERITALYLVGAGVQRLQGKHSDLHAVMHGADRIGLAVPLTKTDPARPFGVVPGLPPGPYQTPFTWDER